MILSHLFNVWMATTYNFIKIAITSAHLFKFRIWLFVYFCTWTEIVNFFNLEEKHTLNKPQNNLGCASQQSNKKQILYLRCKSFYRIFQCLKKTCITYKQIMMRSQMNQEGKKARSFDFMYIWANWTNISRVEISHQTLWDGKINRELVN